MESSIYWSKARGVDLCRFATLPHCILSNLAKPLPHQDRWFPFASPGLRQRKTTQTQSFTSPIYLRLFKPLKPWVFLRNFMCNQRALTYLHSWDISQSELVKIPFSSFFIVFSLWRHTGVGKGNYLTTRGFQAHLFLNFTTAGLLTTKTHWVCLKVAYTTRIAMLIPFPLILNVPPSPPMNKHLR